MEKVLISIPLSIEPLERGDRFDLPLCDLFDETDGGDIVGGGTSVIKGEVSGAEIELEVRSVDILGRIADVLAQGGAPPDTLLEIGSPPYKSMILRDLRKDGG
jgi:hypothetical protein